ncbi:MAG: hypothetical protein EOP09_10115 [Proteobacteria bacterium]|nr:MAG: hypothetical protein EOP09_10115 [Pseudomonadota bacterium]
MNKLTARLFKIVPTSSLVFALLTLSSHASTLDCDSGTYFVEINQNGQTDKSGYIALIDLIGNTRGMRMELIFSIRPMNGSVGTPEQSFTVNFPDKDRTGAWAIDPTEFNQFPKLAHAIPGVSVSCVNTHPSPPPGPVSVN